MLVPHTENFHRIEIQNRLSRDCPGGPVVKILPSDAGCAGSIPGWGTKIPHAAGCDQKLKKKKKSLSIWTEDQRREKATRGKRYKILMAQTKLHLHSSSSLLFKAVVLLATLLFYAVEAMLVALHSCVSHYRLGAVFTPFESFS